MLVGFFKPDLLEVLERSSDTGVKVVFRLAEFLGRRLKETTDKISQLKKEIRLLRRTSAGGHTVTPVQIRQIIVKRERRFKLVIVAGIIATGLTILLAVPGMLTSFLLAFVITYLLKPIVNYFERKGLSRTTSIIVPFLLAGILLAGVSSFFIPRLTQQAENFQNELPKYVQGMSDLIKKKFRQSDPTYFSICSSGLG